MLTFNNSHDRTVSQGPVDERHMRRDMKIDTHGDFEIAIDLFYDETDIWLKKIIALRIIHNSDNFDVSKVRIGSPRSKYNAE